MKITAHQASEIAVNVLNKKKADVDFEVAKAIETLEPRILTASQQGLYQTDIEDFIKGLATGDIKQGVLNILVENGYRLTDSQNTLTWGRTLQLERGNR